MRGHLHQLLFNQRQVALVEDTEEGSGGPRSSFHEFRIQTNRNSQPAGGAVSKDDRAMLWVCAGLAAAVIACYWPVVNCEFVRYDDQGYVLQNAQALGGLSWKGVAWAFTTFDQANWHPLTWLSHMLDVQLFGLRAGWHHLTNMLFHAANTVLWFIALKRLTGAFWRSAMVAALFGLHPIHVESVAWVSERKDVLSSFFMLLSLLAYASYARSTPRVEGRVPVSEMQTPTFDRHQRSLSYLGSLALYACGLMSKPMLVTLPFVFLLLDYWPLNRVQRVNSTVQTCGRLLLEKTPFFVLSALSCVVTFIAQRSGQAMMPFAAQPFDARVENAVISYAEYLGKTAWPKHLAVCYPLSAPVDSLGVAVAAFVLVLISTGVFWFRRERPFLVAGWLWYLGMLVPVIGLVQVGSQAMADRYTYLPLMGIFIALVWLVAEVGRKWAWRSWFLSGIGLTVLLACGRLTAKQLTYWKNSETLARHALQIYPLNPPMLVLLGGTYLQAGNAPMASQHFALASKMWPEDVPIMMDLAYAQLMQGKWNAAIDTCHSALKISPHEPDILHILGGAYCFQQKFAEAIGPFKEALRCDPDHLSVLNDLAWVLATAPDPHLRNGAEAVKLAERACKISHQRVTLYEGTLAAAYAEAGRSKDAVETARKAIALATAEKRPALVQKYRLLLELFELNKPYHQPPVTR
jgi:Flp pilus assembly protein TadD